MKYSDAPMGGGKRRNGSSKELLLVCVGNLVLLFDFHPKVFFQDFARGRHGQGLTDVDDPGVFIGGHLFLGPGNDLFFGGGGAGTPGSLP